MKNKKKEDTIEKFQLISDYIVEISKNGATVYKYSTIKKENFVENLKYIKNYADDNYLVKTIINGIEKNAPLTNHKLAEIKSSLEKDLLSY